MDFQDKWLIFEMLSISSIKFSTVAWIRHGWPNYSGWWFFTNPFEKYERQKWEIIFPQKKSA